MRVSTRPLRHEPLHLSAPTDSDRGLQSTVEQLADIPEEAI
jgi:hypothetical protein